MTASHWRGQRLAKAVKGSSFRRRQTSKLHGVCTQTGFFTGTSPGCFVVVHGLGSCNSPFRLGQFQHSSRSRSAPDVLLYAFQCFSMFLTRYSVLRVWYILDGFFGAPGVQGTPGTTERLATCHRFSRIVRMLAVLDAVVVLCGASAFT